jgi:HSP20 family protein
MGKKNYPSFEVEISKNFSSGISTHVDWEPSTNIIECSETLVVEMELPGVNKEDVSILLQENRELIIRGVKNKPPMTEARVTYYLFEREYGQFYKRIVIDFALDSDNISSSMENGVLTIQIPKKKAKKIAVEIE